MKSSNSKKIREGFLPKLSILSGLFLFTPCVLTACSIFRGVNQDLEETVDAIKLQQTAISLIPSAFPQSVQTSSEPSDSKFQYFETPEEKIISKSPDTISVPNDYLEDNYLNGKIRSSKILLFEDMSGSGEIRYVKEALDQAGYFYLDVGSAKGWFKNQLLSLQDWDLIIAAAEARRDFGGEYFEMIHEKVKQGSAAIIEYWNIDEAPIGKIKPLFEDCGIEFQSDWYDPDLRSIFWLDGKNILLHEPNEMGAKLRESTSMWFGDVGDLLKLKSEAGNTFGKTTLVAGTNPLWESDHAALVTCMDGRVIIQTFSSHDFSREDMIELWQNYIFNSLRSHHQLKLSDEKEISISGIIPPADSGNSSITPTLPVLPSEIGSPVNCGGYLEVSVPSYPNFQKDMFEHHATGIFLMLDLGIKNISSKPIQMWDGDYSLSVINEGESLEIPVHSAATGYLYLENPINLYQDVIEPGSFWRTKLAFDIDLQSTDRYLLIRPGSENKAQLCEVKIKLD